VRTELRTQDEPIVFNALCHMLTVNKSAVIRLSAKDYRCIKTLHNISLQ